MFVRWLKLEVLVMNSEAMDIALMNAPHYKQVAGLCSLRLFRNRGHRFGRYLERVSTHES